MAEISKSDAIDFAASIRKIVNELINEGFDEEWATDFVEKIILNQISKGEK